MDTDIFVLSLSTKDIFTDFKNIEDLFDFSNLNENHEFFSIKNRKVIGKFKIETPKKIWIDEFVCLRREMYSFKCGDHGKIKTKGISKSYSKNIIFEEYRKNLDGEKYQEGCEIYIFISVIHEMYFQQIKKSSLSIFDGKRCYINETESEPWN